MNKKFGASRLVIGLALSLCGNLGFSHAQTPAAAGNDSLLQNAIRAAVNQHYEQALQLIDRVIAQTPQEPLGHLFRAATLQSRMMDYEDYGEEKEFFKSLKTCRQLAEKKLQRQPNDAFGHFVLGSAYGYEAFYVGKKRRYLEAAHMGWNSIRHLETAIRLDSTMYDAYLGIGTYKYYRSKLKLLFFTDEREEGMAMVRKACTHGKYSRFAALNGLTWILLDENNAREAFARADSVLQLYPRSRFFMWGVAESAARLGDYDYARTVYQRLMTTLREEQRLSPYLEAVCRTKLTRLEFRAGNLEAGCHELERAAQVDLARDKRRKEVEKQIEHLQASCPKPAAGYSNGKGAH
ncbi:hypothetical protein HUU05_25550 [candidate division KSB1 bacterium]|nr:hypothetical protein [candidate division KSB1 bacterium]